MDIAAKLGERAAGAAPMYDLIELFFFAYRDFVGDADRLLETYRFGRAHHRVLHFVSRQPGLTIAELLEILKITKQSLNRVLKELIAESFIEARAGAQDRRHRQLHTTAKGSRHARDLAYIQTRRFSNAMDALGEGGRERAIAFLLAMIDEHERERVVALIGARDLNAGEPGAKAPGAPANGEIGEKA
jgi:DNA-binding MarR family transcriptional regulator